jgi:hypothetical protein
MSEQQVIKVSAGEIVAQEIERIIPSAKATPITADIGDNIIQIDNNGIISAVRIRAPKRSGTASDFKITHGGKSRYEDTGKVIGDVYSESANIKEKAIKEIVSQSTSWDIDVISECHADKHNYDKHARDHPSIGYARGFNANGEVGISVEISTPNAEQWEAMKKQHSKSSNATIPSGKIVFKIISQEDVDFDIRDGRVSIQGTIAQVDKVIARIIGNPFSEW